MFDALEEFVPFNHIEGKDPWGGHLAGFEGTTSFKRSDFGKMIDLGPQSDKVDLYISFEGVKAK